MSVHDYLEDGCGGTGYLNCFCGGDFCVCGLQGGMDCGGCEDCEEDDPDYDPSDYEDDE